MSSDPAALFERVGTSFSKLSSVAKDLNSVSDELGRAITAIDAVLQRLNLGVACWVVVARGGDDYLYEYWVREIGYSKIEGRWGISLRVRRGDERVPDEENVEASLFNDAPRWQRVESVEKIPDLIEHLTTEAEAVTKRVKSKIDHAKQLAEAFDLASKRPKAPPHVGVRPQKEKESETPAISTLQRAAARSKETQDTTVTIPTLKARK